MGSQQSQHPPELYARTAQIRTEWNLTVVVNSQLDRVLTRSHQAQQ
ncbi:hypothetical protein B9Z65_881 [Elsinoe australis]|uniref:Uncharacterized protein n=1 Tax=Elsinoe australis TaxID=40998 RepID=A0A2P8AJW2_9PEZI|nr:hypothetical protein B9Z65_881 [Elsinoe australis]